MLERTIRILVALLLVACGSSAEDGDLGGRRTTSEGEASPASVGPDGTPLTKTGLPCDVDAILKTRCQTCHSSPTKYGASAPLVTWDELNAPGVLAQVKARIRDDARPMPPSPQKRLDDAELATLEGWIDAGAPKSDATCANAGASNGVKPLSCKPDMVLRSKEPYAVKPGVLEDETICFGVNTVVGAKRHITALAPKIDNAPLVHHILLFKSDVPVPETPFPCSVVGSIAWRLVAGWAPGGNNLELPPEAGFPLEKGATHWVVQMHYNTAVQKGGADNSGYELCTTEDLRPNDADVVAFGTLAVAIPPRANHTIRCDTALGVEWTGRKFFNASPHMHKLGSAMSTERVPLGVGQPERFFDEKAFSFEAQANYPVNVSVGPGDVIRTRCSWKNTTDMPIVFGETTDSEMCFDFVGYYPKIPLYNWITPSLASVCVPEL